MAVQDHADPAARRLAQQAFEVGHRRWAGRQHHARRRGDDDAIRAMLVELDRRFLTEEELPLAELELGPTVVRRQRLCPPQAAAGSGPHPAALSFPANRSSNGPNRPVTGS